MGSIRNRVVERRRMKASELTPNDKNWRVHDDNQAGALKAILSEVGQVNGLVAYWSKRAGGKLVILDGHLRSELDASQDWDVAICDLTDEEADKVLLSLDPIAAMASADEAKLAALMAEVKTDDEALAGMYAALAEEHGIEGEGEEGGEVELKQLDTKPPPKKTWCLIGIDTVRFGEIAEAIERLASVPGILCETTVSDERKN